ncbi:hypothetical protein PROFUN_01195 [Planoprotostelium fungivorum]|uniref:Uncharacterized protein n=1 Tax=Planoprotostelium fungivorum TaxID=1890364 RepID=A0A2P6NCL9_9EUKA|nr:hypothetical protein PROFUN_01195 [Planoprotostelium fungivorum]
METNSTDITLTTPFNDTTLYFDRDHPEWVLTNASIPDTQYWYISVQYGRISEVDSNGEIWGFPFSRLRFNTTCQHDYLREPRLGLNATMADTVTFESEFEPSEFLPAGMNGTAGKTQIKISYSMLYNATTLDGSWNDTIQFHPYSILCEMTAYNWVTQATNASLHFSVVSVADISVLDVRSLDNPLTKRSRGVNFMYTNDMYVSEYVRISDVDLSLTGGNGTLYNADFDYSIERYFPPVLDIDMTLPRLNLSHRHLYWSYSFDLNVPMVQTSNKLFVFIAFLVAILLVLALAGAVYFVYRHQKKANESQQQRFIQRIDEDDDDEEKNRGGLVPLEER